MSTLNGVFKEIYGDKLKDLIPNSTMIFGKKKHSFLNEKRAKRYYDARMSNSGVDFNEFYTKSKELYETSNVTIRESLESTQKRLTFKSDIDTLLG
jgi:hypothetical protein